MICDFKLEKNIRDFIGTDASYAIPDMRHSDKLNIVNRNLLCNDAARFITFVVGHDAA